MNNLDSNSKLLVKDLQEIGVNFPEEVSPDSEVSDELILVLTNDTNKERFEENTSKLYWNERIRELMTPYLIDLLSNENRELKMAMIEKEKNQLLWATINWIWESIVDVYDPIRANKIKRLRLVYTGSYDVSARLVDSKLNENNEAVEVQLTIDWTNEIITDYGDAITFRWETYKRVRVNGNQHRVVFLNDITDNKVKPLIIEHYGQVKTIKELGDGAFKIQFVDGTDMTLSG